MTKTLTQPTHSPVEDVTRTLHEAGLFKAPTKHVRTASVFTVHPTKHMRKVEVSVSDAPLFRNGSLERISRILNDEGYLARRHDHKPVVVVTIPQD